MEGRQEGGRTGQREGRKKVGLWAGQFRKEWSVDLATNPDCNPPFPRLVRSDLGSLICTSNLIGS